MSETTQPRLNDDAAAAWAVRLGEGALDREAQAELDAWLNEDPRRRGALLRAQAAWRLLDRAGEGHGAVPAPRRRPVLRFALGRRRLLAGGAAAIAASVAGVAVMVNMGARYGTALGEVRRVPLADGSLAAINTESVVDVALRKDERRVTLERGEAWFSVAKDKARPFVVAAGPVRVRAVGTAFSVRLHATGADVLVTEGVVEAWTEGAVAKKVRIAAGARAFISNAVGPTQPVESPQQIDRALAWRDGQIALEGETLAQAAAEFNRYNKKKLVIEDPELAGGTLVGWFHANEPEAFARAAAATLNARVVEDKDAIRLTRPPNVTGI
ncbi:MAG TPA: FecR domain-containing protein [Caulobacteraceae bacterium]|jgi:transmembrane sensor